VNFALLFRTSTYLVGAIPYHAQQYGTAIVVAPRFSLVGQDGQLTSLFQ